MPNGWNTKCSYIRAETIVGALTKTGFAVEQVPMVVPPAMVEEPNVQRVLELLPYDLLVAVKPEEPAGGPMSTSS